MATPRTRRRRPNNTNLIEECWRLREAKGEASLDFMLSVQRLYRHPSQWRGEDDDEDRPENFRVFLAHSQLCTWAAFQAFLRARDRRLGFTEAQVRFIGLDAALEIRDLGPERATILSGFRLIRAWVEDRQGHQPSRQRTRALLRAHLGIPLQRRRRHHPETADFEVVVRERDRLRREVQVLTRHIVRLEGVIRRAGGTIPPRPSGHEATPQPTTATT